MSRVEVPVTMHWVSSPLGMLLALPLPVLIGSLAIPSEQFPPLFGQPSFLTDFTRGVAVLYLAIWLAIFVFAVPMRSVSTASISLDWRAQQWLHRSVRTIAIVTFGAYLTWGVIALARGLTIDAVRSLLAGDPGTMYVLRYQYFESLGGVTTWMQLGALLAPLAILRAKATGRSARAILVWLFALALVRALLNSERLALIEITVSTLLAYLILRPAAPRILRRWPTAIALIAGGWLGLVILFAGFEFFRSWTSAQATYEGGFWSYAVSLLLGYYATALNLAAFDINMLGGRPQLASLFDGNLYEQLFGPSAIAGAQRAYGLETFTNRSGLLSPLAALGLFGGALLFIAIGILLATLARRTARGDVVAFATYCASAVGILEIVRIFYFGSSRFAPVIIAALVLWLSWGLSRAGPRSPHPPATPDPPPDDHTSL